MVNIKDIRTIEEWEKIKSEASRKNELIIFKYSPYCSISANVEEDFNNWAKDLPVESEINCVKVNVISERPISQLIAKDLGVVHQSPQVIWLDKNFNVKWNASHYQITQKKLSSCL